jgi:hypothetical protein
MTLDGVKAKLELDRKKYFLGKRSLHTVNTNQENYTLNPYFVTGFVDVMAPLWPSLSKVNLKKDEASVYVLVFVCIKKIDLY